MRPGPKFEITRDMAVSNIQTVALRLGLSFLSVTLYEEEGSFSVRVLQRKFGWPQLVKEAGLQLAPIGRPKKAKAPCIQGCGRPAYHHHKQCRTCKRRTERNNRGEQEHAIHTVQ